MAEVSKFDVVVVGGGYAGVTAERDLADRSCAVALLAAHDRTGAAPAPGRPRRARGIEFGGAWIAADCIPNAAKESERYGIPFMQSANQLQAPLWGLAHRLSGSRWGSRRARRRLTRESAGC